MAPEFSIVIPAYNQAAFIGETLHSVLNQTFQDFEILVVNDASPDNTNEVLNQFHDPRLMRFDHPTNKGLPSARNTGMAAASGRYIALLDADDLFHPKKLEAHHAFLEAHPEISVTYNARFEMHYASKEIRDIYRPPLRVGLNDLMQGFPFSPSDMVLRREAALAVNCFDSFYVCGGEDLDFPCRLALAGYQFASVDQALNIRRNHSGRPRRKLRCRVRDYTRALESVLVDPRCRDENAAVMNKGLANHYSEVAWWALSLNEKELGQEIVREILRLNPAFASGCPSDLLNSFFVRSIEDHSIDHEALLATIFSNLPGEVACPESLFKWYCARGYLLKGSLSFLFGQDEAGKQLFQMASERKVEIEREYFGWFTSKMLSYQREMGEEAAEQVMEKMSPYILGLGGRSGLRSLKGSVWVNRAFSSFRSGKYGETLREAWQAVQNNPMYLFNRGVLSIMGRSLIRKA